MKVVLMFIASIVFFASNNNALAEKCVFNGDLELRHYCPEPVDPVTKKTASGKKFRATKKGMFSFFVCPDQFNEQIARLGDINCRIKDGKTLLMMLTASNNQQSNDFIKMLLQNGADLSIEDDAGRTALDWSKYHNNTVIAANLVDSMKSKKINLESTYAKNQKAEEERVRRAKEIYAQKTKAFRKSIKAGDESTYGMVIEVKPPLAKVQTTQYVVSHYTQWKEKYNQYGSYKDPEVASQTNPVPVEKWFKIADLFPAE